MMDVDLSLVDVMLRLVKATAHHLPRSDRIELAARMRDVADAVERRTYQ
jgi:hypothetical protein